MSRRKFVKQPVTAHTSFWSIEVESISDIQSEIQKALDAGTTFEDVDDYLNELYSLGKIDDIEFSELLNWAAPFTTNGDVYASDDTSKVTRSQIVKLAQSMLNVTYDEANDIADLAWSYYCDPNNSSSERACIEDAAGYLGYSDVYASTDQLISANFGITRANTDRKCSNCAREYDGVILSASATSDVRYPRETSTQNLIRNAVLIDDNECVIFHLVKKVNGVDQEISHAYANIDTPRASRCWIDLDTSKILTRDQISGLNSIRDLISYEYRPLTADETELRDACSHAAFEAYR